MDENRRGIAEARGIAGQGRQIPRQGAEAVNEKSNAYCKIASERLGLHVRGGWKPDLGQTD